MIISLIKQINSLKSEIGYKIKGILKNFEKNFNASSEQKFIELCFCILVANSSLDKTQEVWNKINRGFIYLSENSLKRRLRKLGYRFYNKRANYIVLAREFIKEISSKLKEKNGKDIREWLVKNIKGIGWKEASHFLRNMGFKNFAILDRHVLNILIRYKILKKFQKTLSKKLYLEIEEKLRNIARRLNITLAELDLYLFYLDAKKICEK